MAFCQNCGEKLEEGAKFCASCGTAVGNTGSENVRKQTFVGDVRKCPSCGAEVPSMTAVCPECGHELNNIKVDNSVKEFVAKLENIEDKYKEREQKMEELAMVTEANKSPLQSMLIPSREAVKQSEKFRKNIGKFGLLFLGVCVLLLGICVNISPINIIPLILCIIIGLGLIFLGIIIPYPKSEIDKEKEALIKSFVIPNSKESIIEFLLLASSQIQQNTNMFTNEGQNNRRWNTIWKTKVIQAISKAKLALADDPKAMAKIDAIKAEYNIV